MRPFRLSLPLLATASLLAQASYAQHAPAEQLAPAKAEVKPAAPAAALGQPVPPKVASETRQPGLAATPVGSQERPAMSQPLYLVNSGIVMGTSLAKIDPQSIASIVVYKNEDIPARWRTATTNGVIDLTLKPGVKIRSVSLARLKRRQHLTGSVRFELDGRPLADTSLRIATAAIEEVVVGAAESGEASKVLNIKLVPWKPVPSNYPPGTIMVRGVAGR